jgi:hypothetical protein
MTSWLRSYVCGSGDGAGDVRIRFQTERFFFNEPVKG